jgi:caffeoyl-CoA O-methyltransferase
MNIVNADIEKYCARLSVSEDPILQELSRETHLKVQMPQMLSGHAQGIFLQMFTTLLQPKQILEIGTFTGYSAICMAKGLAKSGLLTSLDINEELEPITSKYIAKAGLTDKIKLMYGDARQIIPTLTQTFDLVFIDADKQNYATYFDLVINKIRPGGYIIADNVLWSGKVVNDVKDKDTTAIDAFNRKLNTDGRVEPFILPLRDGLNIARKKG